MNIKQAKEQIKNAMRAYFTKDAYGAYIIPPERQRPVFLMGAPGIGKTAIMEQVAQEMGVGLVSYSMTHHTRQSALGLPFIVHKNYGGMECDVSEYTMSEIISSVYDMMQSTGVKEGILFLDEINCVSETLSPVMLQFLQYKIFGRHRVPDGWIVVTAGNPPEYNNSVREFDIVTWDRLKRIDVEPDLTVWKEYAANRNVHPAVLTYLDIRKLDFYSVESSVDGKRFVTARGWEDLSMMIRLYEKNGIKVDELLIGQYLQNPKIAKSFAVYYDLFTKYKSDYQVDKILAGKADDELIQRAQAARFDERLSLLGMLLDAVTDENSGVMSTYHATEKLFTIVKALRADTERQQIRIYDALCQKRDTLAQEAQKNKAAGKLSASEASVTRMVNSKLDQLAQCVAHNDDLGEGLKLVRDAYMAMLKEDKSRAEEVKKRLDNAFVYLEKAFGEGQEMLIFVTELTIRESTTEFLSKYGCDAYFKHNKSLLIHERQEELLNEVDQLLQDADRGKVVSFQKK